MATLALTFPNGYAGSTMRALAGAINDLASTVPDANPTGASYVITLDNAPSGSRVATVTISGGPYLPANASRTVG